MDAALTLGLPSLLPTFNPESQLWGVPQNPSVSVISPIPFSRSFIL